MKRACAFKIGDKIMIQALSRTTSWLWISDGDVYTSDISDIVSLLKNLDSSLKDSRMNIPDPLRSQWKEVQMPMLKAAGVKTWKALAKIATAVSIEASNDIIVFNSSVNYINGGGEELRERDISCRLNDGELGKKFVEALNLAT